jgi:hypothetical protein
MQNKANVKMGNMNISTTRTKTYAKEQRTMSNQRYSKQTQSNPIRPHPRRPCGAGTTREKKTYFFQNPVVTTIELPRASYILVRRLSIDRRSCGALMGGPRTYLQIGGRHPHPGDALGECSPGSQGLGLKIGPRPRGGAGDSRIR